MSETVVCTVWLATGIIIVCMFFSIIAYCVWHDLDEKLSRIQQAAESAETAAIKALNSITRVDDEDDDPTDDQKHSSNFYDIQRDVAEGKRDIDHSSAVGEFINQHSGLQ